MATNAEKELAPRNSAGMLRPLRVPIFRNLLIADLVSDIGTFMQNVGAAWLMVSLRAGPGYVALIQTAASLLYFLLALPAGSAGEYLRSSQTHFVHRSLDGGGRIDSGRSDHQRLYVALVAAGTDFCPLRQAILNSLILLGSDFHAMHLTRLLLTQCEQALICTRRSEDPTIDNVKLCCILFHASPPQRFQGSHFRPTIRETYEANSVIVRLDLKSFWSRRRVERQAWATFVVHADVRGAR